MPVKVESQLSATRLVTVAVARCRSCCWRETWIEDRNNVPLEGTSLMIILPNKGWLVTVPGPQRARRALNNHEAGCPECAMSGK